jgi:pimeloyl-ACP methyl ester carboxylesterase
MSERSYDVLDRPEVGGVLFYPRRDVGTGRGQPGTFPARIRVAPDVEIGGRIFAAQPTDPAILYFHGNGEIASDYDTIAPFYTRLGISLFVVDYRGYGSSDGAPTASAMLADALACFAQARAELQRAAALEPEHLYLMGRSLGSAAALEIADHAGDAVDGVIIESGFAYTFPLIERIGFLQVNDAFEYKDGFGNLEKIARLRRPTLIIHGERDWIIPFGDAEALYEASPAATKQLVAIPGAGHNDLMMVGRRTYFDAIAAFCQRPVDGPADTPA